jgi:hypothetical protein
MKIRADIIILIFMILGADLTVYFSSFKSIKKTNARHILQYDSSFRYTTYYNKVQQSVTYDYCNEFIKFTKDISIQNINYIKNECYIMKAETVKTFDFIRILLLTLFMAFSLVIADNQLSSFD